MATSWVSGNRYLSDAEMRNNAEMFYDAMHNLGFSLNSIAGILGNAQSESGINPGIWESLDPYNGGYGLLQWTPYTNYSNWAGTGWQDNGQKECERIQYEFLNGIQYYPTVSYPMVALEFMTSLDTPENLAETFLYNYERPADPSSSVNARRTQARYWYNYLQNYSYLPRLSYDGTDSSPYYTIWNPYWSYGHVSDIPGLVWLGMNNCTAYAFGRWNELAEVTGFNYNWPTGDGGDWYADGIAKGFSYGNTPQLGAAIVWKYPQGGAGHVAIVEKINYDAQGNPTSFITSNSAFNGGQPAPDTGLRGPQQKGYNYKPWFYLEEIFMNDLDAGWLFQGFIYHPNLHSTPVPPGPPPTPPTPPSPPTPYTGSKMPFMMYLKRIL